MSGSLNNRRAASAPTKILIVEDEGIIARDIQRQVEDLGYEVVEIAGSAEEALARA